MSKVYGARIGGRDAAIIEHWCWKREVSRASLFVRDAVRSMCEQLVASGVRVDADMHVDIPGQLKMGFVEAPGGPSQRATEGTDAEADSHE